MQDHADGVDIGASAQLLTSQGLGRHVGERALDRAELGLAWHEVRKEPPLAATVGVRPSGLCDAPVDEKHLSEGTEHDVGGLDVTVEHAALMGELEGVADLQHDLHESREAPFSIGTLLLSALAMKVVKHVAQ